MEKDELMKEYIRKVKECDRLQKRIKLIEEYCREVYEYHKQMYDAEAAEAGGNRVGCSATERQMLVILKLIKSGKF